MTAVQVTAVQVTAVQVTAVPVTAAGGGAPGDSCGSGEVYDCSGSCVDSATASSYIGDGFCDDGAWGYDLVCGEFSFDGGDCDAVDLGRRRRPADG